MASDRPRAARRARYRTGLLRPPRAVPAQRRTTRRTRTPSRAKYGRRVRIPVKAPIRPKAGRTRKRPSPPSFTLNEKGEQIPLDNSAAIARQEKFAAEQCRL